MNTFVCRRSRGFAIAESAAAICLILPLIFLVIYAVLEMSYAYMLKGSLTEAARCAARDLAVQYGQDPSIATNRTMQNSMVFDNIRIRNVINNSAQFSDPVFNTSDTPPTVQVTVRYTGGQYSLPPFPNPDPLRLGTNFQVNGMSTYRLE